MENFRLKRIFKCSGTVILPVIHVLDFEQTHRNVEIAVHEGASGVFLINHDFGIDEFLPIIRKIRRNFPNLWFGVNFLGVGISAALPILEKLQCEDGCEVDAYWADDAEINEHLSETEQPAVKLWQDSMIKSEWEGLYFGGVAFKKQRSVDPANFLRAAQIAANSIDVTVTSGSATGVAASLEKIRDFRQGCKEAALAVASGITPENFHKYGDLLDAVLVATGINVPGDFYNIDPSRLRRLLDEAKLASHRSQAASELGAWYMDLMAPRSRGKRYAWLDPSSAYINTHSFNAIIDDLVRPFCVDSIDVVAGIDAAGFVLAGALAVRLNKGVLTLRKGGKVPVAYDVVSMVNYSAQTQELEMRKPAFSSGTKVLLVDQWIETGGTMDAAMRLIERQGGVVAGIAVICVEENTFTNQMRNKYKVSSCVLPDSDLQSQCNQQTLNSFAKFNPESCFPDTDEKN